LELKRLLYETGGCGKGEFCFYPQKFILAQYFELMPGVPIHSLKNRIMKKTIGSVGVIALSLCSLAAFSQQSWEAQKNATVDSISAKYKDKILAAPVAKTTSSIFPVLGVYETSTNPEAGKLLITADETNKGIIWVEGLPQGRIKALLTRSPATYKIPAQQNAEGKAVAEGTLIYDKEQNILSICIGKAFNSQDPAMAFMAPAVTEEAVVNKKSKTKTKKPAAPKPWVYTVNKVVQETAVIN